MPPKRTAPEPAPTRAPQGSESEPAAADVEGAPQPGEESGRADRPETESRWRAVARDVLWLPRIVVATTLTPLRAAVWANERYQFDELYHRIFFNEDQTIGLYPIARFDSVFGVSAGGRFIARDLFGANEGVMFQATAGGGGRRAVAAGLGSGDRLGSHLTLGLQGEWERRPSDPFFGIGNGDLTPVLPMPVDSLADDTAIATSYRFRVARAAAGIGVRVVHGVHVIATSALTSIAVGPGNDGAALDEAYDHLVGREGVEHAYQQLELRLDQRRPASDWEPQSVYAAGWLADAFVGQVHRLDGGHDFWRSGIDLQQPVRIGEGPRVLALRFHGETVTGSRVEVPFFELPALGGTSLLRGYSYGRFRDRVAAVGSIEYEWDVGHHEDAAVFVDTGRVYPALDELTLDRLRLGFGVALRVHSDRSFLFELMLASSKDGGIFASLSFDRVANVAPRWR